MEGLRRYRELKGWVKCFVPIPVSDFRRGAGWGMSDALVLNGVVVVQPFSKIVNGVLRSLFADLD